MLTISLFLVVKGRVKLASEETCGMDMFFGYWYWVT